jgi:uncharacterized protein (DUF433 family)
MDSLPVNEYVELREGRHYYLPGTRIGLAVLIHAFRCGETPEAIFQAYPSIGSLAKVYGAIAFILDHPQAIESYLQDQEALWNKFREEHPIPEDMLQRLRRTQEELSRRTG